MLPENPDVPNFISAENRQKLKPTMEQKGNEFSSGALGFFSLSDQIASLIYIANH